MMEGSVADYFQPASNKVHLGVTHPALTIDLLQREPWNLQVKQVKQELVFSLSADQVPALNRYLVQEGVDIQSIRSVNTLEDYFLSLTSGNQHVAAFTN